MGIYQKLKEANIKLDHHESDLYALKCPESKAIIEKYAFKRNVSVFKSKIDGKMWYEIPFAFTPYWERRIK